MRARIIPVKRASAEHDHHNASKNNAVVLGMRMNGILLAGLLLGAMTVSTASAQRREGFSRGACEFSWDDRNYFVHPIFAGNPPYDGRITFARIKYQGNYECGGQGPGWSHDYPRAESHFVRIMKEITTIRPFTDRGPIIGSAILSLDDPELFKYPIAYMSEPGGWRLTDAELIGLRRYIQRGGFIIFDDMEDGSNFDYYNLLAQWRRAFPGSVPVRLTEEHPIFNSFFKIDLKKIPSKTGRREPEYMAIFADNDPKKRMLAIIDNYADVGELIEFSDRGFNVVPATEGYKLWVNYFMYALTH
jgi:hypothetical protein